MKVLKFSDEYKEDVEALLKECMEEEDFDSIFVIGFQSKDGVIKIKSSKVQNRMMMLGALEEAKSHLLNNT